MSIKRLRNCGIEPKTLQANQGWKRPADWPAIPSVVPGEQVFYGLVAVFDSGSNYVSLRVSGNYTVDWGDGGATENVASGVQANHNYSWGASGLTATTENGYRIALVKVIPNGGDITSIRTDEMPSGLNYTYVQRWLHIFINAPSLTSLVLYCDDEENTTEHKPALLSVFGIREHSLTSMAYLFAYSSLREVTELNLAGVTSLESTFSYIDRLIRVPTLDFSDVLIAYSCFAECWSLKSLVVINSAATTGFSYFVYGCGGLLEPPVLDVSGATSLAGLFYGTLFTEVPHLNTSICEDFSYMFSECRNLLRAPALDTSSGTDFQSMFDNCLSLLEVPEYDFSSCLNSIMMFHGCRSLISVGNMSLPACTNCSDMFSGCYSLVSVGDIDVGVATNASNMLSSCLYLTYVGAIDLSSATNLTDIFSYTLPIVRCKAIGMKDTFSLYGSKLGATELNEVYTNLATVVGKTITVTGNPGTSSDNPTIATGKGWAVVG